MEPVNAVSLALLCIFGVSYIAKLIMLSKKNNIKANVFGKGTKPKETLTIEKCLKVLTFIGLGVWAVDALLPTFSERWFIGLYDSTAMNIAGVVITLIGVSFFILAMVFMKTSWRVGIDKSTKTTLITSGLYKYSRNPAFVGMDLMFVGAAIIHTNLAAVISALLIMSLLHLQVLQEEKHMRVMFNKEYKEYASKTPRYLFF